MEWRRMRRFNQLMTDAECIGVLRAERRGVLAMNGENGCPYAVPINFYYEPERNRIYFHGAREGLKVDLLRSNDKVCLTVFDQGVIPEGEWAYRVASVVIRGRAQIVTDETEAERAVHQLGLKYYPTAESVAQAMHRSFSKVQVYALTVDHMTGKRVKEA
ncbi:MAG: pyridoxamine 5'-phosphate oxidase family protein [Peptoniphilaceae bacterium]|nr:pyridoxamine 5'-phosphate oxidase family protein [Peptoniphilaceae bacterium]MDY6086158.1 pyridoxamine 5'-phosphate oxidase family protein [Peptoniphilaceae bacterium]